ncbi:hypothetical protein GO755_35560 [Spirosoma sp. HMF4905]|uniref:Uncharacterized protein n=1 Tax=Spirosoma arboris TaxID=2682092 RepID=A0A7K1SP05_9BACT|nr:hypothetical protein [Spirosoma arboris]MVM35393.1 hypothetical protein [Spirosoma arboris]
MSYIETRSLLVRMGATKGKISRWLADGWLVKTGRIPNKLALDDTFLEASLQVRIPFILAANGSGAPNLGAIFDAELGANDALLSGLLATSTPLAIVKGIADRHGLPYDLKKFNFFGK